MLKQTQSNFRFNFSGWFSQGDIYLPGFPSLPSMIRCLIGHIMQNYVITSCLLSMGVSSAQLTILGMPDREKRWIERRSYFIREKAILLWICEVIDYFIVPLDLMNRPQFLYTCGQNIHLSCKNICLNFEKLHV